MFSRTSTLDAATIDAARLGDRAARASLLGALQDPWYRFSLSLLRDPDLLILDEPAQGVDFSGQLELYALIERVRERRGCGVLLVSHDLHVVMAATDRVICLNGHVCCEGGPVTVQQDPEFAKLFGPSAARMIAAYTHHHDHDHESHHHHHDGHEHGHGHDHRH